MQRATRWAVLGLIAGMAGAAPVASPGLPWMDATILLAKARQTALVYARSLPDFECTEVIQRYIELTRPKMWHPLDTLTVDLSYAGGAEDRRLLSINGFPATQTETDLVGLVNIGEFGGMLEGLFDPATDAHFHWEAWRAVNDRPTAVFSYEVGADRAIYMLKEGGAISAQSAVVGFRGTVDIDRQTGQVLRLVYQASEIPPEFPMQYASTTVEYDYAEAGGRRYLLPVRSEIETHSSGMKARNRVEFRDYRKFSAQSTLRFVDQ